MTQQMFAFILLLAGVCTVSFLSGLIFERNKDRNDLPVPTITAEGRKKYDSLPAGIAIAESWTEPGDQPLEHHHKRQAVVRAQMPLLGRALDRLVETDSSKGVK